MLRDDVKMVKTVLTLKRKKNNKKIESFLDAAWKGFSNENFPVSDLQCKFFMRLWKLQIECRVEGKTELWNAIVHN